MVELDSRRFRLKAVWLLLIPFLILARPTPRLLWIGGLISALGLFVRAWAAGYIHKDKELSTGGPYAWVKNPLYFGSLLIGVGVTVAGGRWIFTALFLLFFLIVYGKTAKKEERLLHELFGERYRHYASRVRHFAPRLWPYRPPEEFRSEGGGFTFQRYRKNREYEALLGVLAGFAALVVRMVVF